MWASKRSSGSKEARRTFASKFNPPGWRPPFFSTSYIAKVVAYTSVGKLSVSQPRSTSPRLASMLPSMPLIRATRNSCSNERPASVAWFASIFSKKWSARSYFCRKPTTAAAVERSEEHTSELQSRGHLVCRLLLEKKNDHVHDLGDDIFT